MSLESRWTSLPHYTDFHTLWGNSLRRHELYPLVLYYKGGYTHRVALVRDRLFVDGLENGAGNVVLPEHSQNRQTSYRIGRQ